MIEARATLPLCDIGVRLEQLLRSYRFDDVRQARDGWAAADEETCQAILDGADRLAREVLEPLNLTMDRMGCTLADGRVKTVDGHKEAWGDYVAGGWPTLEAPEPVGGQELPAALAFAAQEIFDRACPAFGMLPVPQRSASRVIAAHCDDATREEWLERLSSGEWGATICVSEAGAGSDLSRIRTSADQDATGKWRITGEKVWISFGDHDLAERIGHIVLARTREEDGRMRPSLFLVPSVLADGTANQVYVHRIEEKLGLHGSPTCALGFEEAQGILLGTSGRGLAQLFVMIANMRLAVGAMGLGIASASLDVARQYASERLQGGRPEPLPIERHADVRLQLLDIHAPVHLLRGLLYAVANLNDLAATGDEGAGLLSAWLLPLVKTLGGEVAFDSASAAIQVLGGAGYTQDWPVEQALRDARVLMIFEGTTGMQASDLVLRRLIDNSASFDAFMKAARALSDPALNACLDTLEKAANWLRKNPDKAEAGATAFLHLAGVATFAWIGAGYVEEDSAGQPASQALAVAARHWLQSAPAKAVWFRTQVEAGAALAARYAAL
ncbi:acyl-CoA dehydrogenase family protein [Novosphingobium album (ex Hu et al. 2023)]|uniref:Acyl-CoA dehydrogenase family protein n=1 Tax=Novosphingobium album (ex Hu et al. 2023) TaxID=2930093 RepID=A0ABT0B7U7_9SPHN|nr:acyl-CoA dehydrogenase family protein [Novosphingobium album (ex Hu et al. 2023)]MCJ2180984.1 acyl-CoA dehydrogenase family protein [Novosphingobium album (ex Hu et al. 2023)]